MTRSALIYARYSSDLQNAASIEDQVRLCRERLDQDQVEVRDVFIDRAISGSSLQTRSGIQALLDEVARGSVDVVISEALDRLSRDQEDIARIYKRLRFAQVTLMTLAEGEINELHIGLKGTMNALFLKDLANKTRRGQRGRVEAGKIPGGKSYGYRLVPTLNLDGTVNRGEREIVGDEARVIRRIFEAYVGGKTARQIAADLNKEGVSSPRGGSWNASTINGNKKRRNGILNNELYLGNIIYNRQSFLRDPETGKRRSRPNPEALWVTKHVPQLQIIDHELWDKAQAIKAKYASQRGNKRQTRKRLLTGLVRCGRCGGGMTIIGRERYACSAHREQGTCTNATSIKAQDLEQRVLNGLQSILLGHEETMTAFAEAFHTEVKRRQTRTASQKTTVQQDLLKVETGIKRCVDLLLHSDTPMESIRNTLEELEMQKRALTRELSLQTEEDKIVLHPNIGELYARKIGDLKSLLQNDTTKHRATEIIRSLIEKIVVSPTGQRGKSDVVLHGALASILAYASETARSAVVSYDVGRVLMVAGAGFEPATFRL
jgi:site-specific DNA recombinase